MKQHLTNPRDKILPSQHKVAHHKYIEVGALVFRKAHHNSSMKPKKAPCFEGPFRVKKVKNKNSLH